MLILKYMLLKTNSRHSCFSGHRSGRNAKDIKRTKIAMCITKKQGIRYSEYRNTTDFQINCYFTNHELQPRHNKNNKEQ